MSQTAQEGEISFANKDYLRTIELLSPVIEVNYPLKLISVIYFPFFLALSMGNKTS